MSKEPRDRTGEQWAGIQKIIAGPNTAERAEWDAHSEELFALAIEHWPVGPRELARQLSGDAKRRCVLGAYDFATGQGGGNIIPIEVTILRNMSRIISSAVKDT